MSVIPGMVGNPFAFMRRADILALPSEEEGFGRVLIEAMAVGLPIVATRCPGGPVEILGDGEFGKHLYLQTTRAQWRTLCGTS